MALAFFIAISLFSARALGQSSAERPTAVLDSSDAIWRDLLASVLQDSASLPTEKRASFFAVAQSLDSCFVSVLRAARLNASEQQLSQAALADTMLALYDSLASAFEFFRAAQPRSNVAIDYQRLLADWLRARSKAHRFSVRSGYQSRSAWRGIDQNPNGGAYSFSATYQHRSGVFVSASLVGLEGQAQVFDQLTLSAGLDWEVFDDLLTSAAFSRYWFSDASAQARSSIQSDLSLWVSYSNPVVTPALTLVWAFGDSSADFFCSWELSRAFSLPPLFSGRTLLVPSVSGEYGTISLVRAFATRSRRNPNPQTRVETSSPFVLTNYNVSLAAFLSFESFSLVSEFVFVVPVNASSFTFTVSGPNLSRPVSRSIQQGGKSFGYVSMSASWAF